MILVQHIFLQYHESGSNNIFDSGSSNLPGIQFYESRTESLSHSVFYCAPRTCDPYNTMNQGHRDFGPPS